MRFTRLSIFIFAFLMAGLMVVVSAEAADEIIDPNIPDSWYEAPRTASEMNITEFNQSPVLEERVASGELPPVEERLPDDPPVVEPYNGNVGKYGGTVILWDNELGGRELSYWSYYNSGGGRTTTSGQIVPSVLEDWDFSEDYKSLTLHLREGLKFSDGTVFTADDYIFWWEHIAQNQDLNPTAPEDWKPGLMNVTKEDNWTVTFHWNEPAPLKHFDLRLRMNPGSWEPIASESFMQQFHPDFIGMEKAEQMAEEKGLEAWDDYYLRIQDDSPQHPEFDHVRPTIYPYVPVERTETSLIMERNPYYPFVDTEGNQLPYVDRIRIQLANSKEMAATKAATGEATFAARHLKASDIPLYKKNEERENFTTYLYSSANGAELALYPNPSTKDDVYRKVFNNVDFRRAMSLGINRENINEKVFFGRATPRQATVPPVNQYFKPEFAEAYADYDPERANALLDEIGMVDQNDDGYRETPDGEDFNPTLTYVESKQTTSILELVRANFEDIKLDIDLQMVSRELHDTRKRANEIAFSCWGVGQVTGLRFRTPGGVRNFAPVGQPAWVQWPGWTNWYLTDGEEGMEPPASIKEMIDQAEIVMQSTDEAEVEKAATKLLENQADQVWMIGTVGMAPIPLVVSNNLKNVPKTALWGTSMEYTRPLHTEQFYLEE